MEMLKQSLLMTDETIRAFKKAERDHEAEQKVRHKRAPDGEGNRKARRREAALARKVAVAIMVLAFAPTFDRQADCRTLVPYIDGTYQPRTAKQRAEHSRIRAWFNAHCGGKEFL